MRADDFAKAIENHDLDQLKKLEEIVGDRIRDKQKEKRVLIWSVTDGCQYFGHFKARDYLSAVACLSEQAKIRFDEYKNDIVSNREMLKISIKYQLIIASEVGQYFQD